MTGQERLEFVKDLMALHEYIGKRAPLSNASDWQKNIESRLACELDLLDKER